MTTPICDFISRYADSGIMRLHMPGHKGSALTGMEPFDITEIEGADSLYEADGIIRESEENASALFGCPTVYSTEGSSLCIRAMLYLAVLHARSQGKTPHIAAGRNAHKTFLSAAALLDFQLTWLTPETPESYLSCPLKAREIEAVLAPEEDRPTAVYLTSPDYLGNTADIAGIAEVCHRYGVLLLTDNAHGAYLRFLHPSRHPMDLGADMCCDSAHKTLPVLTGGAYLHVSETAPAVCRNGMKNALALFGSTSPSYLILRSLDRANLYLAEGYPEKLAETAGMIRLLKEKLTGAGYTLRGDEPMKLTVCTKPYGYTGQAFADVLRTHGIEPEFADPDFCVLMLTPENAPDLPRLTEVLLSLTRLSPVHGEPPRFCQAEKVLSVREAVFSESEQIPAEESAGRILAAASVGCPPAVPIVICGERIGEEAVMGFRYYGIGRCTVVKET